MSDMRDYVIITDSTTDLPPKLAEELELTVLPLAFVVGEDSYRNYLDERELPIKTFYQRVMAGESVSTSQISTGEYVEAFRAILEQDKDLIYLGLSSGLSATMESSLFARDQLRAEYPQAKILCVDSISASGGQGLLAYLSAQQKKAGLDIEALYKWMETNKRRVCHWFTVNDLMHLYRHGRCSGAAAFAGSLLHIQPVLHVDDEGRLIPMEKVRNAKKALEALVDKMAATVEAPEEQVIFINHSDNPEGAQYVEKLIRERWQVRDVVTSSIGPVVGAHTSQGTVALFFLGSRR
ncbi:MAG: DegV family protein [Clostridiales bacterium]|nr:DegV family protein [Clostridiales bacterium]